MMLYTIIAYAQNIEAVRDAYANWRSDCAGMFTTGLADSTGKLVAYISSGFLDEDPTMVADGTEVYPNTSPQEVIDELGYSLFISDDDSASV